MPQIGGDTPRSATDSDCAAFQRPPRIEVKRIAGRTQAIRNAELLSRFREKGIAHCGTARRHRTDSTLGSEPPCSRSVPARAPVPLATLRVPVRAPIIEARPV